MKFPEGGGIFYANLLVEEPGGSRGPPDSKTEGRLEVKQPRLPQILVAQLELLGDRLITAQVGVLQIIEQAAALADHHQQPAAGAVILVIASANARSNG